MVRVSTSDKVDQVDPVLDLAQAATKQDIEHHKEDTIGQMYFVASSYLSRQDVCRPTTSSLQCSVKENTFVNIDVCFDLDLDVTIAGDDFISEIGLFRDQLSVCKDSLKDSAGDDVDILGDKLVTLSNGGRSTSSRIVFVRRVAGIHLAWFTAVELGYVKL